ncbi:hypothetical protein [Pedobacter agri]|uniref:hypothetical protein n=1 Tax=Pedobacter agri TaxID=454586 RepID=UPI0029317E21|nr:hypothetical protein [Pedobacter agri]
MNNNFLKVSLMCEKLNGILSKLDKPLVWSAKEESGVISLSQHDKKRQVTQTVLRECTANESFLFLKGYYLAIRNLSMSV